MSVLTQTFIVNRVVGFGDITDIDTSLTGTIGGFAIVGATILVGGYYAGVVISAEDECFFPDSNAPPNPSPPVPINGDPPFPPVWPYLFSTDLIYGRDHLSTNIKMIRGDTFAFDIAIILNGAAVDITGGTLTMTAKWSVEDTEANAVFVLSTTTSGITITDATGGLATITIPSSDTVNLPAHVVNLNYDVQLLASNGNIYTVLNGTLSVYPDVTTPS